MTKTLSLKPGNAATARIKLEAHERKIGLPPSPEPSARPAGDGVAATSHAPTRPAQDDRPRPRKDPPARPDDWSLTLDVPKTNRQAMAAELEAAIVAAEAVPPTPKQTRDVRIAATIARAAPSWPIGELRKREKHALAKALHSSAFGLRIARFTDVFEKSVVLYGDADA